MLLPVTRTASVTRTDNDSVRLPNASVHATARQTHGTCAKRVKVWPRCGRPHALPMPPTIVALWAVRPTIIATKSEPGTKHCIVPTLNATRFLGVRNAFRNRAMARVPSIQRSLVTPTRLPNAAALKNPPPRTLPKSMTVTETIIANAIQSQPSHFSRAPPRSGRNAPKNAKTLT